MKKILMLFAMAMILTSCGGKKDAEAVEAVEETVVETVEEAPVDTVAVDTVAVAE